LAAAAGAQGADPASRAGATRPSAPSRAGRYAHRPRPGATRLGPCGWPRKATAKAAADGRPPRRRAEAVVHRPADGHHTGEQRRASAVAGPVSLDWAGVVDAEGGRRPRRRCRGATREREERWSCAAEEGTMALV